MPYTDPKTGIPLHSAGDDMDLWSAYVNLSPIGIVEFLKGRMAKTYDWANLAERTAQTGMVADDRGYQRDTGVTYIYTGPTNGWSVWEKKLTTFVPTIGGGSMSLGTTGLVRTGTYSISGGWCFFDAQITMGSGATWGDAIFTPPFSPTPVSFTTMTGTAYINDANGSLYVAPVAITSDPYIRIFRSGSAGSGVVGLWNSSPTFTLAATDQIGFSGMYRVGVS